MRHVTLTPEPSSSARSERERVQERLRRIVHGLIGAWHEAGDRARDQDAALALGAHVAAHLVEEVDRAADVRVDDAHDVLQVLIEERSAQTAARIGEQRRDGAARHGGIELVDAVRRGEICLHRIDRHAGPAQRLGRCLYLDFVGDDDQVVIRLGATPGQLEADTGGRTRDYSQWTRCSCHESLLARDLRFANDLTAWR